MRGKRKIFGAGTAVLLLGGGLYLGNMFGVASAAVAGPALGIDVATGRHSISPDIYGMNYYGMESFPESYLNEMKIPVRRWGGNNASRYNYLKDTTNAGSDWYFENGRRQGADPTTTSATNKLIDQNKATGSATLLQVPMIGWVTKDGNGGCGFSVAKYGAQEKTDQWNADCGNGKKLDGTPITGNDPKDTSVAVDAGFVRDWVTYLTGRYGKASEGGVKYYEFDNETDLWNSTHRDVHPAGVTFDEIRDKTYATGAAIKGVDPTAKTVGPSGWGWLSLFQSKEQQNAHGGMEFAPWYLTKMKEYEKDHGVRILDYFDNHLYPQQKDVTSKDVGDANRQALRLRSTRQLWDPTYKDESWINQSVQFIPQLKKLVDTHYPGTKTAITEYNFGALNHINGALTQADILGIFGREGLDMATIWGRPQPTEPGAYAFRMYMNYDGQGSHFGNVALKSTNGDQSKLVVYPAERSSDGAITLMIINKTGDDLTSQVSIAGRSGSADAKVYRYSSADLSKIVKQADQAVTSSGFSATFPANSITEIIIPKGTSGPTASASTSRPAPTSSSSSCSVKYEIANQWPGGFAAHVKVTNKGSKIDGWDLKWKFQEDEKITEIWNGKYKQTKKNINITNENWNKVIDTGKTATVTFNATRDGSSAIKTPKEFKLNGKKCSIE